MATEANEEGAAGCNGGEDAEEEEGSWAAAINGGVDDVSPVQMWDTIVKTYKIAQVCEAELARIDGKKEPCKKE